MPADGTSRGLIPRIAAIGCLAGLIVLISLLWFGGDDGHRYRLLFENAGQLVNDNQVMIGGHPVGSVESIDLTDDGQAAIEISLDQELHEGTTAMIRATSLAGIANHYISITPGMNSEPELAEEATIGAELTSAPVDLDQVLNAFTPRTRAGLSNFIKGQAGVYEGKGKEANRSYKYLEPALSMTNEALAQVNKDERLFEQFITGSARVFTTLASRRDDLSGSVANANQAFAAIARENIALDQSLERLPGTFRQSSTAFVNLRAALDDLDSLVNTAKPATKDLTPFLKEARPVVTDAVPFFRDFALTVKAPGPANDLAELTALLPSVQAKAAPTFDQAEEALADFQPTLDFARPYAPEMIDGLAKLGQVTGYYDANGHYARTLISGLNLFDYNEGTTVLDPAPAAAQYSPFGAARFDQRCPGGATQSAPDGSNPFYDPPWNSSGLSGSECNPSDIPPLP